MVRKLACSLVCLAAMATPMAALAGSASLYVQDGLIACWDGIENAGAGVHNTAATVWKDLLGGCEFALAGVTVDDDRMTFTGDTSSYGTLSAEDTESTFVAAKDGTMEIVYVSRSTSLQVLLQSTAESGLAFGLYNASSIITHTAGSTDNKPLIQFSSGTTTNSVSVRFTSGAPASAIANGESRTLSGGNYWGSPDASMTFIGKRASNASAFSGSIYCIRLYNRQLSNEEIAANHAIDIKRFREGNHFDDALEIIGEPNGIGSPVPAYGNLSDLSAGSTVDVSCGEPSVITADGKAYACTGWKLYDVNGDVVSSGTETAFTYTHPTPAEYRRLEWQWAELLTTLPIPDQVHETFDPCRPELTVSNMLDGTTWTIGGNLSSPYFDVEYTNNFGAGTATATVTGKGDFAGFSLGQTFSISATKLEDENISTTDVSARRCVVAGKYVYIFTNAAAAQVSTVKRELLLTDYLVVGGGGGGGNTSGGGGGGGGVTNATGIIGKRLAEDDTLTVSVGAGGAGSSSYNGNGANGKATSFAFGDISVSVAGGGGGGSWFPASGTAGASGGGGTNGKAGGAGTAGIGHDGATAGNLSRSGGGGGAGHAGYQYTDSPRRAAGNGGEGVLNSITGEALYYGGGGGGGGSSGGNDNYDPGFGGLGGGGDGEKSLPGHPGTDGLGGGGGGGGWTGSQQRGGNGGSGTVILALMRPVFEVVPIPVQVNETFEPCCPEFVVSNNQTAATWTVGGDIASPYFDVEYTDNFGAGTATVAVTGKGELYGAYCVGYFNITATKLADENISTTDTSARRLTVGGKSVYVFSNASSVQTVTAKRGINLTDYLVVGGGGGGGAGQGGGGGGGGGVTNATGLVDAYVAKGSSFTLAVGAGGAGSPGQSDKGGTGGTSSFQLGMLSVAAHGGGGGGSWNTTTGASGASGGGGCQAGAGGAGIDGFGFAGAAGGGGNSAKAGGGGGADHAGYAATTAAPQHAGYGGEGVSNNITGAWAWYGGGGGGGGAHQSLFWKYDPGIGGLGGGGDGGKDAAGENGVDGLGGGGGGGGAGFGGATAPISKPGGNGGSGAVILVIVGADFEVEEIPDQYVTGGACEPLPVVRDGTTVLVKGTDYNVAYANNEQSGAATMTITGIGTYAGKTATVSFKVISRYFAKPSVSSSGDGRSWATAMSVPDAFAAAEIEPGFCEIWMQSGTVSQPAISIVNNGPLVVRGGFAGTETTLSDRQPGGLTTFDGEKTSSILLSIDNATDDDIVLDRIKFCRAKSNGFIKTGKGGLKAYDCVIEANGRDVSTVYGRGMNVQSDGYGSLVVSNCVFAGNRSIAGDRQYGGFGIYVKSFREALIDNSLFVTNGYDLTIQPGKNYAGFLYARGSAILAEDSPITVRNSRFAGNCCPVRKSGNDWCGGTIALWGACGGSVIEHCALIGNTGYRSADDSYAPDCGGAVAIKLNSSFAKATVRNCTIAYNLTHCSAAAGGITVTKGSADIVNTILWKNARYHVTKGGYGKDVHVASSGSARLSHSLVTSLDAADEYLVGANLVVDPDTVFAADPRLVTSTAAYESLVTVTDAAQYYTYTNPSIYEDLASMDAHLLSPAGYCLNGGAAGPATAVYSPAIDRGDPDADYLEEPSPNGARLNLGAYGNTSEASLTATGQPTADVAVTFPDGLTRPLVTITMGLDSGSAYVATVHLVCAIDGVTVVDETFHDVGNGDVLTSKLLDYLQPGTPYTAFVTVSAASAKTVSKEVTENAIGALPPFYGKGGGPNVIHVREGADCKMDGTSWTDAYPDLRSAFASAPDASKAEVWLAISDDCLKGTATLSYPIVIRGGFTGVENSPDERPEGFRATIDGRNVWEGLSINNSAAVDIERILFIRGLNCGLIKTGAGDMRVSDCLFLTNGLGSASNNSNGKGARVSGTTTTVVTFTNCVFRGNRANSDQGGSAPHGGGIHGSSLKCLRIEDSLFVHNGIHLALPGRANSYYPSTGDCSGSAVYSSAPVSAIGCRFAANFGTVRNGNGGTATTSGGYGGTVRLVSGSEGSAFTNCAWVANGDQIAWPSVTAGLNTSGPLVVHFGDAAGNVDVERCTFAYNLADGYETTAGLNLIRGTANVHNSIFFGNILGGLSSTRGQDISLRSNSVCNVSYTLFGELGSNSVSCAETATTNFLDGIVVGDPLFVTEYATMTNLVKKSGNLIFWDWTAATLPEMYEKLENANVHLRGGKGYFDENTGNIETGYRNRDEQSPAMDAGDPKSDYRLEPVVPGAGGHGYRVNLGAYGNTPWATMSAKSGFHLFLR